MTEEYRATDILGLLSQMGDSLSNLATGEEATLRSVLSMVTSAMPTSHVVVLERLEAGFKIAASIGLESKSASMLTISTPRGILKEMASSEQTAFVRDIERDGRYKEQDLLFPEKTVRSVACLPIAKNQKMHGALYVATGPDDEPLGESNVRLLVSCNRI